MKICVCGWYFNDDLYASLWRIQEKYPVFIVAHRDDEFLANCDLPYVVIENTGLEWGAYDYYLQNVWDGDPVLFMHDDHRLLPIMRDFELQPPEMVFDKLACIQHDQAYIFRDRREDVINYGQHGRMLFCSQRLLLLLKTRGGFPYDRGNVKYDNYGTNASRELFSEIQAQRPGWSLLTKVYAPSIDMGYRGQFADQKKIFMVNLEKAYA